MAEGAANGSQKPAAAHQQPQPQPQQTQQQQSAPSATQMPQKNGSNGSTAATATATSSATPSKRRKVNHACVYCRRSHMTCDAARPCTRCVKRNIGHLCHDEYKDGQGPQGHHSTAAKAGVAREMPAAPGSTVYAGTGPGSSILRMSPSVVSSPAGASIHAASHSPHSIPGSVSEGLAGPPTGTASGTGGDTGMGHGGPPTSGSAATTSTSTGVPSTAVGAAVAAASAAAAAAAAASTGAPGILGYTPGTEIGSSVLGNGKLAGGGPGSADGGAAAAAAALNDFSMLYDNSLFGLSNAPFSHFASEHTNNEFLVLSDFLNIMGSPGGTRPGSPTSVPTTVPAPLPADRTPDLTQEQRQTLAREAARFVRNPSIGPRSAGGSAAPSRRESFAVSKGVQQQQQSSSSGVDVVGGGGSGDVSKLGDTPAEKFFLAAADPVPESAEDRLKQVINAKVDAGLMRPFDYVRGYARLQKYMEKNMSAESRQRILAPLSQFRPAFRAIAKRLTDVDLVLVEEAFERLLLDYDRVFTSMAVPSCLWRRTGEIFRGNKEFAALLGVDIDQLRDGRLAITELMDEDSAVNYWEKYGNIAFDGAQKAVLTSCLLLHQASRPFSAHPHHHNNNNSTVNTAGTSSAGVLTPVNGQSARTPFPSQNNLSSHPPEVVSCCFSFTIKRDRYNIPSCIVGNFIPIRVGR
ncbi:Transcription factor [Savitreella phatthalungensis]